MEAAWAQWEADNNIETIIDPVRDALYNYDHNQQKQVKDAKAWKKDVHYFKNVRISAAALLKMVTHVRSGGTIEVMGLMLGAIRGDTFVITDAVRLPVEGTETRVNAQEEANEFIVNYMELLRDSGRDENPVGWYHSHPGYGCWLSGIDVATQSNYQTFDDPFLAVVIDPERTMSQGKVEIGAFRTYPDDYKPQATNEADGMIPTEKAADFGAHYTKYYSLEVSYFKSTLDAQVLDALWSKYWVNTLSSNTLLSNRDYTTKQIKDLAKKLTATSSSVQGASRASGMQASLRGNAGMRDTSLTNDKELDKLAKASRRIETHQKAGHVASQLKDEIFRNAA